MAIEVPGHVLEAAREGRTQFVLEQLARRRDWPIDRVGRMMLRACCGQRTNGQPRDIQSKHVDLARALLDRGADPKPRNSLGWTPLQYAARGLGDASVDMVALLLDAHGDVRDVHLDYSPLPLAIRGLEKEYEDPPRYLNCRRIARLLVRAGAPLYELTINQVATLATNTRTFATQEHLFATTQLIYDVAAAGSPQAYRIASRKKVLLLRSLALKGRAEPRDARMTFLVDSPNEIAWKILEYWRTLESHPYWRGEINV